MKIIEVSIAVLFVVIALFIVVWRLSIKSINTIDKAMDNIFNRRL